ncbi:MAG: YqgE/AlgH family protein [Antricoccus sp.]
MTLDDQSRRWISGSFQGAAELLRPQVGRLLVAMPILGDPNFDHTIVFLVGEYEDGYQGIIINDSTHEDVMSAAPDWWQLAAVPRMIHRGGPCDGELVLCLGIGRHDLDIGGIEPIHRYSSQTVYRLEGAVDPDVTIGKLAGVRMFRGYAGWAAEQLEQEIAEGAWLCVPSEPTDVITNLSARLWRDVLERQAGCAAFLRTCPANPDRN